MGMTLMMLYERSWQGSLRWLALVLELFEVVNLEIFLKFGRFKSSNLQMSKKVPAKLEADTSARLSLARKLGSKDLRSTSSSPSEQQLFKLKIITEPFNSQLFNPFELLDYLYTSNSASYYRHNVWT